MTTERWERLQALLDDVLEQQPDELSAFLGERCADDPSLAVELETILRAGDDAPAFLEQPATETFALDARDPLIGTCVGRWRIEAYVASGGMGAVYRARRDEPAQGDADDRCPPIVAVKVIKRGMDSGELLRRFAIERTTLAGLSHPAIVGFVEAGSLDDGRPYLVMEHVEGEPIDRYCARERLALRDVLELFREVCAAVASAHRALVVHRDLKPGNVLVTTDGRPKLLDFGVAKLLDVESGSGTTTLAGLAVPRTPRYASPELLAGAPVTTAADVYSLGVVLAELAAPFPIRDGSDIGVLVARARHDDPERRYASVEQLRDDVGRYLAGLPVRARRDSLGYRAGLFVRRHALGVAAAILVVLSLAGGAWAAAAGWSRARASEGLAWRAHAQALQVGGFYGTLLAAADWTTLSADTAFVAALDAAAADVGERLAGQPEAEGRVRRAIAFLYGRLGRWDDALPQLLVALDLARHHGGFARSEPQELLLLVEAALVELGRGDEIVLHRIAAAAADG